MIYRKLKWQFYFMWNCVLLYVLSAAGLEAFISAAKKLPSSDVYDVVEGYIKISMECIEIFKLLEGEKHSETEVLRSTFMDLFVQHVGDRVMYSFKKIFSLAS